MDTSTNTGSLRVERVSYHYPFAKKPSIEGISFTIEHGTMAGLFGRNGSGKTSLMYLLAGLSKPQEGYIRVGETDPFTRPNVAVLMSSGPCLAGGVPLEKLARYWSRQRPTFDVERALELLDRFEVPNAAKARHLSQGQRAAANAAFALASRTQVTLLDEIHLGMDAVVRRRFYDALLEEFLGTRATYLISSHQIEEIEPLISGALIVRRGRLIRSGDADELRSSVPGATSLVDVLDDLTGGKKP